MMMMMMLAVVVVVVVVVISTGLRVLQSEREMSAKENKSKGYTKYRDLKTQQKYLSEEEEVAEGTSVEEDEDEDEDDDPGDGVIPKES